MPATRLGFESAGNATIAKLEAIVAQKDAKIGQTNEVIPALMEGA